MMQGFDFEGLLLRFRYPLLIFIAGLTLLGIGLLIIKTNGMPFGTKVEVLEKGNRENEDFDVTVEIAGGVLIPGVYKLKNGSRVDDLLVVSGGFSAKADRVWTDKYLNRAAKLTDGQKVFIPLNNQQSNLLGAKTEVGDQSVSPVFITDSNTLININTAGLDRLDSLPGIGPVYGQNIIDHRPYSNVEELLSKGILKKTVYEKIKNLVSVY